MPRRASPNPCGIPQTVAHRLNPDGHDPQWVLPMPSCLFIHHSCLWGHLRPSTGRQPGLHCGAGGAVEGEAGTLFTRPAPPCWPAEAGGGSGDSTPLYRQNLLSTIWPLGRQVPAGRRLARNLQGGRLQGEGGGCRRRMQVQKRIAAAGCLPGSQAGGGHSWFTGMIASPPLLSQHHSTYFMTFKKSKLRSVCYSLVTAAFQTF